MRLAVRRVVILHSSVGIREGCVVLARLRRRRSEVPVGYCSIGEPAHRKRLTPNESHRKTKRMDFDETRLYFSHQQLQRKDNVDENGGGTRGGDDDLEIDDDNAVDLKAVRRHFREFLSKSFVMVVLVVALLVVIAHLPASALFQR